jgi:hypothetical protein
MKKLTTLLPTLALSLLGAGSAAAADLIPWQNHNSPYNFLFGNEIDTHQQTRQAKDGSLIGFFYIKFTGVVTADRYRVASHADCRNSTLPRDCTAGWSLDGSPVNATFLYHVEPDHPVFLVNRQDIPEPGAYAHFHWLDYGDDHPPAGVSVPGYLLQLTAKDKFCFFHDGAEAQAATSGKTCRDNGGITVNPGVDIATHLNIVTSAPPSCASGC